MRTAEASFETSWRSGTRAVLLSVAAHLLVALAGTLLVRGTRPAAAIDMAERVAEIVLANQPGAKTEYFAEEDSVSRLARPTAEGDPAGSDSSAKSSASGPLTDQPPLVPGLSLPERPSGLAGEPGLVAAPQPGRVSRPKGLPGLSDEAILATEPALRPDSRPTGPAARLSLFGSGAAEGRSFVFVIDRSASMSEQELGAIRLAAAELSDRLGSLSAAQTFQVVAYNQTAAFFTERELLPATDDNKRRLVRYVSDLAAFGQTQHMRGLIAALRLDPEVVFLFTDGDPELDAGELRVIRELAAGRTSIHCLHFGRGAQAESGSSFARMAAENRGSYVYIDVAGR